jgi:NitT/TauT family transport system ATP-binding protein
MDFIKVDRVGKTFHKQGGQPLCVLDDISLRIQKGEFVTFFGPNGSGKTTLLNILAGIELSTMGMVRVEGKPPGHAKVGFVFQNYNESMMPWRTAIENVLFPLEILHVSSPQATRIAENLLKKVGLLEHKEKYFYELSGGQKQLVAICRAYAYNPDLLIMDEPFSSLDYSTTRKMEMYLLNIWKETKKTTLFVSHDVDEAIFLADKIIVLSRLPARVKEIISINLPRPRKLSMLSTQAFFRIRQKVLRMFENE